MIVLHKYVEGICMNCGKPDDGVRPQLCSGKRRSEDHQRTCIETLTARCEALEHECNEWKARATFAEKELSDVFGLPPTIGPSEGEAKRVVDRLRDERRQLRRRLLECRSWVGVCPLTPARINEMCLIRDLADDTLDEVPE